MFIQCTLNVHSTFTQRSLNVHSNDAFLGEEYLASAAAMALAPFQLSPGLPRVDVRLVHNEGVFEQPPRRF
jgi:hypothetical protein